MKLTQSLRAEYDRLFSECVIRPKYLAHANALAENTVANKERYQLVVRGLGVPWYFLAAVHGMESGFRWTCHLHNGDSLLSRTVRVPSGRPRAGSPPFTWEASADDALRLQLVHRWRDWSVPGTLYRLERYNGWGYRKHHLEVLSPYLWSWSEHYSRGKYVADGSFSNNAVSKQCGAAVLLRRLAELGHIAFTDGRGVGPWVHYDPTGGRPFGRELQSWLNQYPGVFLEVDGKPGPRTSAAYRTVTGHLLPGDPSSPQSK
jgi:lysozyme family protein